MLLAFSGASVPPLTHRAHDIRAPARAAEPRGFQLDQDSRASIQSSIPSSLTPALPRQAGLGAEPVLRDTEPVSNPTPQTSRSSLFTIGLPAHTFADVCPLVCVLSSQFPQKAIIYFPVY